MKQRTLGSRISACLRESVCHGEKLPPTTSQMLVKLVCRCSAAGASHSEKTCLCGEIVKKQFPVLSAAAGGRQVTGSSGPRVEGGQISGTSNDPSASGGEGEFVFQLHRGVGNTSERSSESRRLHSCGQL